MKRYFHWCQKFFNSQDFLLEREMWCGMSAAVRLKEFVLNARYLLHVVCTCVAMRKETTHVSSSIGTIRGRSLMQHISWMIAIIFLGGEDRRGRGRHRSVLQAGMNDVLSLKEENYFCRMCFFRILFENCVSYGCRWTGSYVPFALGGRRERDKRD